MELHTLLKKERAKLLYLKLHLCAASGRAHSGHSNSDALNGRGPGGGQTAFGLVTMCAEQAVPCPAGGEATPEGPVCTGSALTDDSRNIPFCTLSGCGEKKIQLLFRSKCRLPSSGVLGFSRIHLGDRSSFGG